MKNYSKRQNKKTLGIQGLKGVAVLNVKSNKGFTVRFRAELKKDGERYFESYVTTSEEAAQSANRLFKRIFGTKKAAVKAGYWND